MLEGEPVLVIGGRGVRLEPGRLRRRAGRRRARLARAAARWIDMRSPRPREDGSDTFALGRARRRRGRRARPARSAQPSPLRAARGGHGHRARFAQGAAAGAPTVSASMATAALLYSGITVKMLVDERLDAQLLTMFMVDYRPGAVAHPHDHPFEESYVMLDGEVDVVADGERYTLRPAMSSGRPSAACTRSTRCAAARRAGWRRARPSRPDATPTASSATGTGCGADYSQPTWRPASSIARSTACAFETDSRYSLAGMRVGDGAAARLQVRDAVLDDDGADVDRGVELAGVGEVADRAAVAAALDRLELVDDLHRADLRRARERARRERRAQRVHRADAVAQAPGDGADDVHDVRVVLDRHQRLDRHAAVLADAAEVVAAEVDEHHVLGALLLVGEQVALEPLVLGGVGAARPRAGDRARA